MSVRVVDPVKRTITESTAVAAGPDYVRFVNATGEIWLTEPFAGIEVFSLAAHAAPKHEASIDANGGPEAIAVDETRGRVYTNSFTGSSYAVDIAQRKVVETWSMAARFRSGWRSTRHVASCSSLVRAAASWCSTQRMPVPSWES